MEWISRSRDDQADFFRRIFDSDDWGLSPLSFHHIDLVWGPHSVDRFANHVNGRECQTPPFQFKIFGTQVLMA